ncbi:MAG: CPBP family intramembrane metalloprotease [Bacteroidales bacterium]|nr:CPBP family intramembrane metalloprotease [Bacteroidales bacterium]
MDSYSIEKVPFFENKKRGTQFFYLLFFLVAGLILSSVFAQAISLLLWGKAMSIEESQLAHYYRVTQFIGAIGTWLCPALLFSYLATRHIGDYSHANRFPQKRAIFLVALLGITLLPAISLIAAWNAQWHIPDRFYPIEDFLRMLEEQNEAILNTIMSNTDIGSLLLNILTLGVLPAICEEFFFRGTLQPLLQKSTGNAHIAVWLTAFIFSVIHFEFSGLLPRFLLGLYLGYLFLYSQSIWLSSIAHFIHNSLSVLAVCIAYRHNFDIENLDIQNYKTAIILCTALSFLFLFLLFKRLKEKSHSES